MPSRRELLACALLGVALCAVAYRRLLFEAGTPNFAHDWAWSPWSWQIVDNFHTRTSFVRLDALGGANTDVAAYPCLFLLAAAALVLGSSLTIKFYLVATTVFAAIAAAALARACRADPLSSALLGLAYAAGPFAVNKIASGQVTVWLAYAVLPVVFWALLNSRSWSFWPAAAIAGLALALIAPQLQIFTVTCLAALAAGAVLAGLRGAAIALTAVCVAALTQAPFFVELTRALHAGAYSQFLARSPWEFQQSPLLRPALRLDGYFTQSYALATIHLWHLPALGGFLLAAVAWLGLIARPGARRAGWFVAAGAAALLASASAYHLPWAHFADHVFLRVPAATIFRELYDLIALLAVAYLIGAARAASIPVAKYAVWIAASAVIAVGLAVRYDAILRVVDLRDHLGAVRFLAAQPGDDRVWPVPNGRFLRHDPSDKGGFDPFFGRIGRHAVLEEYFPSGPVAAARMLPLACALPLLRSMDVRFVWQRADLSRLPEAQSPVGPLPTPECSARANLKPVYSTSSDTVSEITDLPPAARTASDVDVVPDDWLDGIASLRKGRDFIFARDAATFGIDESELEAPLDDRRFINPAAGPVSTALFAGAGFAFAELAGAGTVVSGRAFERWRIGPQVRFVFIPRFQRFALTWCGPLSAPSCVPLLSQFAIFGVPMARPVIRASKAPLQGARLFIDETQYDPALRARAGDRELTHVRVDGYANGWIVPAGETGGVIIADTRRPLLLTAWIVAALSWSASFFAVVAGRRVRRAGAPA